MSKTTHIAGSDNVVSLAQERAKRVQAVQEELDTEAEWKRTLQAMKERLTRDGGLYKDDPRLMDIKAYVAIDVLRQMVEDAPPIAIAVKLPDGLTKEQERAIAEVLREAALQGMESALHHCATVFSQNVSALATSMLKTGV